VAVTDDDGGDVWGALGVDEDHRREGAGAVGLRDVKRDIGPRRAHFDQAHLDGGRAGGDEQDQQNGGQGGEDGGGKIRPHGRSTA